MRILRPYFSIAWLLLFCSALGAKEPPLDQALPPKGHHPLELTIDAVDEKTFEPGDPIAFVVTLTNRSDDDVFACKPDWDLQKGIVKLKVFDSDGRRVPVAKGIHADYVLRETTDLRLLKAGGDWQGRMILGRGESTYSFGYGPYYVLASYHCPFEGERRSDGGVASVIHESQTSRPVRIEVDYRGWFQKLMAWLKGNG